MLVRVSDCAEPELNRVEPANKSIKADLRSCRNYAIIRKTSFPKMSKCRENLRNLDHPHLFGSRQRRKLIHDLADSRMRKVPCADSNRYLRRPFEKRGDRLRCSGRLSERCPNGWSRQHPNEVDRYPSEQRHRIDQTACRRVLDHVKRSGSVQPQIFISNSSRSSVRYGLGHGFHRTRPSAAVTPLEPHLGLMVNSSGPFVALNSSP